MQESRMSLRSSGLRWLSISLSRYQAQKFKEGACNNLAAPSPKGREPILASPVSNSRHHKTWRDQMLDTPEANRDQAETAAAPNWALDAPRGGKTVMNRILKENATVPLFFAQTLIASLR